MWGCLLSNWNKISWKVYSIYDLHLLGNIMWHKMLTSYWNIGKHDLILKQLTFELLYFLWRTRVNANYIVNLYTENRRKKFGNDVNHPKQQICINEKGQSFSVFQTGFFLCGLIPTFTINIDSGIRSKTHIHFLIRFV